MSDIDLTAEITAECLRAQTVLTADDTVLMMAPGLGPAAPLTPALAHALYDLSGPGPRLGRRKAPSAEDKAVAAIEAVAQVRETLRVRVARDAARQAENAAARLTDAEAELARAQAAVRAVAETRWVAS